MSHRQKPRLRRRLALTVAVLATSAGGFAASETSSAAPGDVVYSEDFSGGEIPDSWTPVEGEWEVADGRLRGTSGSSGQLSRITFGPSLENYRVEATMRFESVLEPARWAGLVVDIAPTGEVPWTQAIMRSRSTASNGIEFAQRTAQNTWLVTDTASAPTDAGIGHDIDVRIEVQRNQGKWFFDDQLVLTTNQIQRSEGGVMGLALSGGTISVDDVVVTELEPPSYVRDPGDGPATVAHRGYSASAPENTLAAVEAAIRANPEYVEIDTHITLDGIAVVMHDTTLDRTTNGTGLVAARTYDYISTLDAGSWFSPAFAGQPVPTLDDVLDLIKDRGPVLLLEMKAGQSYDAVADQLQSVLDRDMADQVLVQSFDDQVVRHARNAAPEIPRAILRSVLDPDPVAVTRSLDAVAYNPNVNRLLERPEIVQQLNDEGIAVMPYTINDTGRWATLTELGVDAVITDRAGEHMGYRTVSAAQQPGEPGEPAEPTVSITAPADGAQLRRYVPLMVAVSTTDATSVEITLDGAPIGGDSTIDLRTVDAGSHQVVATATGPGGTADATVSFDVIVDLDGFRVLLVEAPLTPQERTVIDRALERQQWRIAENHIRRSNSLDEATRELLVGDLQIIAGG